MTPEPTTTLPRPAALSTDDLAAFREAFEANPANRLAMNACSAGNVDEIALNRRILAGLDWHFSHEVKTGTASNQKKAGFCWMFAALNWLRTDLIAKLNVEDFEFSHNHIMFYDRLEKANRFLAEMVRLRDRPVEDREVDIHLREPSPDGGEWYMVANLIKKYGLVPKSAANDTANLVDSTFLNKVVDYQLRDAASRIFARHRAGADEAEIRGIQRDAMAAVYRILCILMGEPPQRFDFAWRDKDEKHHVHRDLTPHGFYETFVGKDLDDYAWVMSCPLEDTPFGGTYYVTRFQNVVEGQWGVFLNLPIPAVKAMAVRSLQDGQAMMFGCDVLQESSRKLGVMARGILQYDLLFGTPFAMDRATRMRFLQATMTHDMVLLGVDLVGEKPVKWKIENSWGDEVGKKGIFVMTDDWFDEHVYGIVIHKKYLDAEQAAQLKQPPTALPPWHPMA